MPLIQSNRDLSWITKAPSRGGCRRRHINHFRSSTASHNPRGVFGTRINFPDFDFACALINQFTAASP
jgi:hypothetical protein